MSRKYKNKVIIDNDRVIKKKNDKILELYEYFDLVNFDMYPKILNIDEENIEYEFIRNKKYHELSNGEEFIKTVSIMHYKTLFYKTVNKNKYKIIYDKLLSNINYLKKYYEEEIIKIENEVFMSPSHYLFARNYSSILYLLKYSESKLKKWFSLVETKTKERVCVVHNNLSLNHFIKGDKNYLISFDNYLVDTPILDLYKFYKKEGYKLDFDYLLEIYNQNLSLQEEEKTLLYVLISIPPKMQKLSSEFQNTKNIKKTLKYIYDTINVISKTEQSTLM